jgi:hypothetical protein
MDAVYILKHSINDDFEIRYSLRSIEKYAPFIRKVWIYGDRPGFISNDTSIIEHVPHERTSRILGVKTPVRNTFLLMFLSSLIPGLSSEYLFFSDDFFILKDLTIEEARKVMFVEDMALMPLESRGRGAWNEAMWRTFDLLQRLGYTGYNFETHVPTYLTRSQVMNAYCEFKDFVTEDRWYGMIGPTAILNHAFRNEAMRIYNLHAANCRGGFWHKPAASYEQVLAEAEGKTFFNFDDDAFDNNIRRFLSERFPEPSKFEKAQEFQERNSGDELIGETRRVFAI